MDHPLPDGLMEISIKDTGAFASANVTLAPGERFVSESGCFFHSSPNVEIDVTTRRKSSGKGGLLGGIKSMLGGESFFLSTYQANDGQASTVHLAPGLPGDVRRVDLDGSSRWLCFGGSYLGSAPSLDLDTQGQGFKGLFSGESLFAISVSGQGPLLVSAYGAIHEAEIDGELIVDTGHLVAFEDTLDYEITKAGGSWLRSMLGGEGLVMRVSGKGRLLVQSHDAGSLGRRIGRLLPPRQG